MFSTPSMQRAALGLAAGALVLLASVPTNARRQDPPVQNPPRDQAPQRPVFRVGTDVVRIDVYPRRDGRVVEGLTRDDFQVFEDGTAQTIETFEYVELEKFGDDVEVLDPRDGREAMRMAADPRNRVFVFFLDTYHVSWEGSLRSREPILEFMRDGLGPRDLFGVLTPQQSPELLTFGRATSDAAMAMSLARPWGLLDTPVNDPDEMLLQSCSMSTGRGASGMLALWRFERTLYRLEELIIRLSALRQERKNIVLVSDRWPNVMMINRAPAPTAVSTLAGSQTDRASADTPHASAGDGLRARQGGRGSFPTAPGLLSRNNVCAVEGGRLAGTDFRRRMQDLPELARAANVAIYVLVPGLRTLFNDTSGQFRGLAEDTDGLSLFTNDIGGGLGRIVDHQTGYYMLGYRSASGPTDTRTREIEVKTIARGVDLEVRREIYIPTIEDLANRDAGVVERTDIERTLDALERIRETTNLFVHVAPRAGRLDVTAEVATRALAGARWRQGGSVEVVSRDAAGAELGRGIGQIAPGARSGRVFMSVSPDAVPARLTVRVKGRGGDLSEFVSVPDVSASILGAPLVWRAGSLPSMPYEPAAEFQFQRTERVRLEWPILAGPLDARNVRVVNAAGEERAVDLTVVELEGDQPVLRADMRVLSLAPADYVIEATASSGDRKGRQLLAFRVLR
ncbi:MAG TPA: VWA domain-containing protein [Vicinamibacterales bacterium]|nr:VWA domain-containing protein [Vicinamibacterales bacterium]